MGLSIILEDADRVIINQVADPLGQLYDAFPRQSSRSFHYLPYVDLYGDTVFNRPQMEPILKELELLTAAANDLSTRRLLAQVMRLATQCRDQVHLYLRFVGE